MRMMIISVYLLSLSETSEKKKEITNYEKLHQPPMAKKAVKKISSFGKIRSKLKFFL